jgi:hypothetical protein
MPEYLLIIIAVLIGLLVGYLARGTRSAGWPRKIPPVVPPPAGPKAAEQEHEQEQEQEQEQAELTAAMMPPHANGPLSDAVPPAISAGRTSAVLFPPAVKVATEVLDVADHLDNGELALRLIEAVVLLPGVSAVRPELGDGFQPRLHEWAGHRITDEAAQWNTIAQTLAPGAITSERTLLRAAQVIVFESPEQS